MSRVLHRKFPPLDLLGNRSLQKRKLLWFNEKFEDKKKFNDFDIKTGFCHLFAHQNLYSAQKAKFFITGCARGKWWDEKVNLHVFYRLSHQVPDSLLIFRLFSKSVWISIVITVITVAFAYSVLLTMIDGIEGKCE